MTTFTGPLKVQTWQANTTVAQIETSGTATFAGGLFTGEVRFQATIEFTQVVAGSVTAGAVPTKLAKVMVSGTQYYIPLFLGTAP